MHISEICYKKTHKLSIFFLVLILCTTQNVLHSQNRQISTKSALTKSISTQKSGMIVLGSWATLNIITGSVGFYKSNNDSKYFYQMNAAWNVVNLGIAGFGYRGALKIDPDLSYRSAVDKMQSFENLLLINAGLDLFYIGGGALLWKRGIDKDSNRQIGYGKSIVLQGSFLLLFDTVLYIVHSKHTNSLVAISDQLAFTGNGILFSF
jgi:hypothetical protein